jgi:hypothetical protein
MLLAVAGRLTQGAIIQHKDGRHTPVRHEQALLNTATCKPVTVGTSAFTMVAFHQLHIKGDRETALT